MVKKSLEEKNYEAVDGVINLTVKKSPPPELPQQSSTPEKIAEAPQIPESNKGLGPTNEPSTVAPSLETAAPNVPIADHSGRWLWITLAIVAVVLLGIHMVWSNVNASHDKFRANTTVVNENTINPSDVAVNVTTQTLNNYTIVNNINARLEFPPEFTSALLLAINRTNATNAT